MALELVTIPDVPLVSTGTYHLATGEHTFTEEELRAAVEALSDKAVHPPRIKIDGLAETWVEAEHGGEPAFGHVENMRLTPDGQTILGDLKVPGWLADSIEWAYPARSIEGPLGWTTATGKTHELVITAVALLGVDLPGVSTLPDLQELLSQEGPVEQVEAEQMVIARSRPGGARRTVQAGLDQDLVRRRFYDALDEGALELPDGVVAYDLWIRSLRFDDSGTPYLKVEDDGAGELYRVDFTVSGSEVDFDGFTKVVEQDVAVAAASDAQRREPLAVFASRAESRAVIATDDEQETTMNVARLRERLGLTVEQLPDDATDEQINAALDMDPPEPAPEGGGTEPPPAAATAPAAEPTAPEPVAASSQLPEGMAIVDQATLADLRAGARTAQELAARSAREERDRIIAQAMGEGRFMPSRREAIERLWDADPEGTRIMLTASEDQGGLAPGFVPVEARGTSPQDTELTGGQAYDSSWLPDHVRERVAAAHGQEPTGGRGARIVQEV